MTKKPKILLTNDDGIRAPGLKHLWRGLHRYADIFIVAPVIEQSGAALGITIRKPIHIETYDWPNDTKAWSVSGTPADCVKMAVSVLLSEPPDLIVSGINRGSNAGRNVLYSGTVGGVIEGVLRGIPGIAISSIEYPNPNYEIAEQHVLKIIQYVIESSLPRGTFLNVNFPSDLQQGVKGLKMARQGKGYWMESPDMRHKPLGETYYWLGGKRIDFDEAADSDISLLAEGYATVVPVHVDELTDHGFLRDRKSSFESYFA